MNSSKRQRHAAHAAGRWHDKVRAAQAILAHRIKRIEAGAESLCNAAERLSTLTRLRQRLGRIIDPRAYRIRLLRLPVARTHARRFVTMLGWRESHAAGREELELEIRVGTRWAPAWPQFLLLLDHTGAMDARRKLELRPQPGRSESQSEPLQTHRRNESPDEPSSRIRRDKDR